VIFGYPPGKQFPANAPGTPCFIELFAIRVPFWDAAFKWIFPSFSGADSLEGDFDESGNPNHTWGGDLKGSRR
jgi:hypothetical protein